MAQNLKIFFHGGSMKYSLPLLLILTACASGMPVLPTTSDVKLSRETPGDNCENLGPVEGRTISVASDQSALVEDIKQEAIRKGANYIKIETMGAQNSAMRGIAYYCK
jgi:hypothetical protein